MRCLFTLVIILIQGCTTAGIAPSESRVEVRTEKPAPTYRLISGIDASDGEGCGITKKWGTREAAIHQIQAKAAEIGADYVWITEEIQPHREGSCRVNTYLLKGQAYRQADGK